MDLSPEHLAVRSFWNTEACGSHFIRNYRDEKDFYDKYREFRYRTEWHIPLLVPFSEGKDKTVLEIGCGNGADGVMFALNAAKYTGVDLTQTAVDATRKHFEIMGLPGIFKTDNAEHLSFDNETFDIVYSWGVLHHTPNPDKAIQEVFRVLRKGGKAIVMLYHRRSFNYYCRILLYMRLRLLLKIMRRIGKWGVDRQEMEGRPALGLAGNEGPSLYDIHYENFLREGWRYLTSSKFVHHCTDGPECPYAYVYSKRDVRKLFSDFTKLRVTVAHFPLRKYNLTRWVPLSIEKYLAFRLGWNLVIVATK